MFIRKKKNKSGVVSIQIISKKTGKYQVVKTVGSSSDAQQIESLCGVGRDRVVELTQQGRLNFEIEKERALTDMFFTGINEIRLKGPELLLGKLFDEIGFSRIKGVQFKLSWLSGSFKFSFYKFDDLLPLPVHFGHP